MLDRRTLLTRAPLLAFPAAFDLTLPRRLEAYVGGQYDQNLQLAISAWTTLTNNVISGTAQLSDLQNATSTAGALFISMQQAGVNATIEQAINANQDLILENNPSQTQITSIETEAQTYGSIAPQASIQNCFVYTTDDCQAFLTTFQSTGMFGQELNTTASLHDLQQTFFALSTSKASKKLAIFRPGTAHLVRVSAKCPYAILGIAWAAIALVAPPPLDFACLLISLYYQLVAAVMC
jgi:hypothetical protein